MRPGDRLAVASTKYDGSHHYRYQLQLVSADPRRLVAYGPAGTHFDSYRGRYLATYAMLHVHVADRDWNLEVMWHADGRPHEHYVNVALPSTWADGTLRFVDLDLDVIARADGTVKLDDADEFARHRIELGYPPEVIERAERAADEVLTLVHAASPLFDGSLYAWRPGDTAQLVDAALAGLAGT